MTEALLQAFEAKSGAATNPQPGHVMPSPPSLRVLYAGARTVVKPRRPERRPLGGRRRVGAMVSEAPACRASLHGLPWQRPDEDLPAGTPTVDGIPDDACPQERDHPEQSERGQPHQQREFLHRPD